MKSWMTEISQKNLRFKLQISFHFFLMKKQQQKLIFFRKEKHEIDRKKRNSKFFDQSGKLRHSMCVAAIRLRRAKGGRLL